MSKNPPSAAASSASLRAVPMRLDNGAMLCSLSLIGTVIYAFYGYQHSCLRKAANGPAAAPRTA